MAAARIWFLLNQSGMHQILGYLLYCKTFLHSLVEQLGIIVLVRIKSE